MSNTKMNTSDEILICYDCALLQVVGDCAFDINSLPGKMPAAIQVYYNTRSNSKLTHSERLRIFAPNMNQCFLLGKLYSKDTVLLFCYYSVALWSWLELPQNAAPLAKLVIHSSIAGSDIGSLASPSNAVFFVGVVLVIADWGQNACRGVCKGLS